MPLLERESALDCLAGYADQATAGAGRLVLIGGEAGIGKSSLVEALAARLPWARWAWGLCDGLFTPRPLGPLFDIAATLGGELGGRAPREELFAALLRTLGDDERLDVVVIEDLHWADEATIDLVRFLTRRIRTLAVLLIVTYRDDALTPDHPLRLALGDLGAERVTRRIGLAPLSAEAVGALAAGSGLPAADLHRLTGGNPFFVTEVIRAGSTAVPASARDVVLARVAGLGAGARTVLETAALIGARVDPGLLGRMLPGSDAALDDVTDAGLLVGDGPWLRFRHELARLAVEQAIPAHRTGRIHAAILAALRSADSDDDAGMAHHAEAARDTAAAWHFAMRAAERAAELASHREAAAQYERALRNARRVPVTALADLNDRLTDELSLLDRGADQAAAAERAVELWRTAGDRLRTGDALRRLSIALVTLCRGAEAIAAAEEALATLAPLGPGPELARAYAHLASQRMLTNRHHEAIDLAVRAQEVARPLGLYAVLSDALNTHACSLGMLDRPWLDRLTEALDLARTHALEEKAARAYSNLYGLLTCERRYAEAEPYYVDGVAYCHEHDVTSFGTCLHGERTVSLARTDRWEEAVALGGRLLTRVEASPINRISPLLGVATVRARRGDDDLWPMLDEATTTADGSAEPQWIVCARLLRAEVLWLAGADERARAEAELADDVAADGNAWLRGAVAMWLSRTGSARPARGPLPPAFQLFLDGDWAGAEQEWLAIGSRYEAALCLLGSSDVTLLRRALAIADELGAAPAARLARRRLRGHGVRSVPSGPRRQTRDHPAGLTRREHEVLDLLCAGCSNAEIAARLTIAVKTVDHHVSAVLAKLGAANRAAAAAQARQLGLVGG
ncbi:ATP-binding protein [Actinoplanes philippinensis]|uniref:ATP-binding protein n=1 Tax=Actinoplanes philippinensis TaxID=35752 RepID=UPI0033F35ECE